MTPGEVDEPVEVSTRAEAALSPEQQRCRSAVDVGGVDGGRTRHQWTILASQHIEHCTLGYCRTTHVLLP